MSDQERLYVKGFNNGYILTKHRPKLAAQLLQSITPSNDYLSGFISGKEEYEFEYSQKQLHEINRLREGSNNLEKEL